MLCAIIVIPTANFHIIPFLRHQSFLTLISNPSLFPSVMDIFGICSILCFLVGTPLNITSCAYFSWRRRSNKSVTLIYSLISITDTAICFLSLAPMVSYMSGGGMGVFRNVFLCTLWDIFMEVSVRFSLFCVAMLSVCRAHALLKPLHAFNKEKIKWASRICLLLLCLQEALPAVVLKENSVYVPQRLSCHFFGLEGVLTPVQQMVFKMVTFFGEIGIPMIVGLVTGTMCVYTLTVKADKYHNASPTQDNDQRKEKKREATKTIIIITALCVLLNFPTVCLGIAFTLHARMSLEAIMLSIDLVSGLMVLNSLVNTLVYFLRIGRMRSFTKRLVTGGVTCTSYVSNQ